MLRASYRAQVFTRHTHPTFVIGFNEASAHKFYCRHGIHTTPPGALALVNPEEVHTGENASAGSWNYRGIYPDVAWMQNLCRDIDSTSEDVPMFETSVLHSPELAVQLLAFHRSSEYGADPLRTELLAVEAMSALLKRSVGVGDEAAPRRGGEPCSVSHIREYLHAHYARTVSLAELAQATGRTRLQVLRFFRQATGMTPYEYVTSLRLERARELLATGCSIVQAALSVGFGDQSHMHRRFRRHFGVTPGALKRALETRSS